jgi:short-subunit dehydrogenase
MQKRVVITGAASGIGRETAHLLSSKDHNLVLIDCNLQGLEETKENCLSRGASKVAIFHLDLAEAGASSELAATLNDLGSGEIVFISIAGTNAPGAFLGKTWEEQKHVLEVNLVAPIALAYQIVPLMLEQGAGQLILLSSIAAKYSFTGSAVYCASKAGLLGFGRILSEELREQGIRVTNILPGSVDTPLWAKHKSTPPLEDMLSAQAVAEVLRDLVLMPNDRNIDLIELLPPKGTLSKLCVVPNC